MFEVVGFYKFVKISYLKKNQKRGCSYEFNFKQKNKEKG